MSDRYPQPMQASSSFRRRVSRSMRSSSSSFQRALFDVREELVRAETASYVHVIALYKALGWGAGGDAAAVRTARAESTVLPDPSVPH